MEHIGHESQYSRQPIEHYSLPALNRNDWARKIKPLRYPSETDASAVHAFSVSAQLAAESHITADIRDALKRLADPLSGVDGLVIDALPHNASTKFPESSTGIREDELPSEAVLIGLARTAGCELIGYKQERYGALVHQVIPISGEEATQSSTGSVYLDFHTDDVFLPRQYQPEFIGLFGIINERMIPTSLLLLTDILSMVPRNLLIKLREERFFFPAPYSFKFDGDFVVSGPRAIIDSPFAGVLGVALPDRGYNQPDPDAQKFLAEFLRIIDGVQPRYILVGPGVFLGFRNSRLLHGRCAIEGRRWLQRVYFNRSLDPLRQKTNSGNQAHVFDANMLMDGTTKS